MLSCATCFSFVCLLLFAERMIEQTLRLREGASLYVLFSALALSSMGSSAYAVRIINVKGVTDLIKSHNGFTAGCSHVFLYSY